MSQMGHYRIHALEQTTTSDRACMGTIVLVWECKGHKASLIVPVLSELSGSPNSEADPRRVIADIPRQVIADIPRQVIADILRQVIADIVRLHLGASRIIRQHVHKRRSAPVQC
jgi:hypothetical protein